MKHGFKLKVFNYMTLMTAFGLGLMCFVPTIAAAISSVIGIYCGACGVAMGARAYQKGKEIK